jgi:hypothetical protein
VTSRGVQRTDAWLHAEISTDPRPLRDQLWYRFIAHRARMRDASELTRDVRIRRETAFQHLRRLDEQLVTIDAGDRYAPFIRVSLRMHVLEWQAGALRAHRPCVPGAPHRDQRVLSARRRLRRLQHDRHGAQPADA